MRVDPIEALTDQFLAWLDERPRHRAEVIETWRSTCPRLAVFEDALAAGRVACGTDGVVRTVRPDGLRP